MTVEIQRSLDDAPLTWGQPRQVGSLDGALRGDEQAKEADAAQ
jgi:hypothetical protein